MSEKAKETNTKNRNKILSIVYIGVSAALIAICSWIQIPLTVPITLQTMGVCLVSGLLGLKRGTLATLVYIVLGAIGIPVFAGFSGGMGVILGSTGGYIVGFIFTALIVGIYRRICGAYCNLLVDSNSAYCAYHASNHGCMLSIGTVRA